MKNSLVQQFTDSSIARWFRTLSKREQILVYIVLAIAGVVLSILLLTSAQNFRDDKVYAYQELLADLDWMKANEEQARLKAGMTRGDDGDWRPIYRNAELHNIEIRRIERGSDGATISIEAHPFQDVLNWIFALQEDAGMHIESVYFDDDEPGMVTTSLVIQ